MKRQRITPEETKKKLILAGLQLFGINGLEATRTRELAGLADVNQAAIPYHFGGKEGLYLAVAKYVVQRGREDLMDEISLIVQRVEQGNVTPHEAGMLYIRLICLFMDKVVMAEDIADRSRFILREYSSPGAAFDIIYDGMLADIHRLQCALVGLISGEDPKSEAVVIRTHSLFGIVMSNIMTKTLLCKRLGWDDYDSDRIAKIKKVVVETVANGLKLDADTVFMEAL